jgi:hypothetical protein
MIFCPCPDGVCRFVLAFGDATAGYGDITFPLRGPPPGLPGMPTIYAEARTAATDAMLGRAFASVRDAVRSLRIADPDIAARNGAAHAERAAAGTHVITYSP